MLWGKRFCSWRGQPSIYGVADARYHNKRIVNPETGNNPIFLGPTLFHFTKNDKTFSRLALELLDTDPELINLKTIGANIEEAITKDSKE